jgi:hypothetical protein
MQRTEFEAAPGHGPDVLDYELSPCPFCGGEAQFQSCPDVPEIVRVGCVNQGCDVRPRTEYLLDEYVAELRSAWNRRPRCPGD